MTGFGKNNDVALGCGLRRIFGFVAVVSMMNGESCCRTPTKKRNRSRADRGLQRLMPGPVQDKRGRAGRQANWAGEGGNVAEILYVFRKIFYSSPSNV